MHLDYKAYLGQFLKKTFTPLLYHKPWTYIESYHYQILIKSKCNRPQYQYKPIQAITSTNVALEKCKIIIKNTLTASKTGPCMQQ